MKYIMLILLWSAVTVKGQSYRNFNQLDSLQKITEKKVLVFVYTDWCKYCKAMEEVVFKEASIAQLLSEKYYLMKLNAEEKQPISYKNQTFIFNSSLGFHELAIALARNAKLSFPVIYILNNQNQILYQHNAFIDSKSLLSILK